MKKILQLIAVYTLLYTNINAQSDTINHWETIFYSDTLFSYWPSYYGEPDSNWRELDYLDTAWNVGKGGIGYGDEDDLTIIDTCTAVFYRIEIDIFDSSKVMGAVLHIDYDDAFVAFLNGTEIARSNGFRDKYPSINYLTNYSHEAIMRWGLNPEEFYINKNILDLALKTGINVLAFQVHNSRRGELTDLSSNTFFSVGLTTSDQHYLPIPEWFNPPKPLVRSNLPIFIIATENNRNIPVDPKITANLKVIYNGLGQTNYITDSIYHYNGYIGIETRGNSTEHYAKQPYSMETRDSLGENNNISLLGLPKENDWILRASYFDHTFIRNPIADHMSRLLGNWASRTKHVEIVLNGEYIGIYILMEKIKRDSNRVNIAKLNPDEITGENISGGYIWEISGQSENLGQSRTLKYPKYNEAAPEQIEYITAFDNGFRDLMRSDNYSDNTSGYSFYIDVESFIDEIIVQEAMRNSDAYGWSGYFHKDKNGPIKAGPVWDFDQSSGNSSYPDDGEVEGWLITHSGTTNTPFFWRILFEEPKFRSGLKVKWEELRKGIYKTDNLIAYLDSIANHLSEAQEREFARWNVLGQYIWRETNTFYERDTYQKEVDYLRDYLIERWKWMDATISKWEVVDIRETLPENMLRVVAYPNPAVDYINFSFELSKSATIKIQIYNSLGRLVQQSISQNVYPGYNIHKLNLTFNQPGMYMYKIFQNENITHTGKFIIR